MAELADAADSKSAGLRPLGVQFPLPAPANSSPVAKLHVGIKSGAASVDFFSELKPQLTLSAIQVLRQSRTVSNL